MIHSNLLKELRRKNGFLLAPVVVLLVLTVFTLSGCLQEDSEPEHVVVQASWIINGQFSFVCSAIVEGYYAAEELDVELRAGGPAISFLRSSTLLAQDEDIDISVESVLTEFVEGRAYADVEEQLRLKAIGAFWQDNPLGFLVRSDSGPKSLEDLVSIRNDGSRYIIGATPDAILIEALADYYSVEYDDLEIVTTGFDATPFLAGQVDALWSFWTTQAYEAEVAGIPYEFLSLSEVPGLGQPSNIILTTEKNLRENPEMLERWFRASLRGADFTLTNPEQAARNLLDERCGGSALSEEQELWLIERSLPLFKLAGSSSGCVGYIDPNIVTSWVESYLEITGNPNVPNAETLLDMGTLEQIYDEDTLLDCADVSSSQ